MRFLFFLRNYDVFTCECDDDEAACLLAEYRGDVERVETEDRVIIWERKKCR